MGRRRWLKKERNRREAAEALARPRIEAHRKAYFDDMMGWMNVAVEETKAGRLPDTVGVTEEFGHLVQLTRKALGFATLTEAAKHVQASNHDYARTFSLLEVDIAAEIGKTDLERLADLQGEIWDEMAAREPASYLDAIITNAKPAELRTSLTETTQADIDAVKETLTRLARNAAKTNPDIEFVAGKAYIKDG